MKKRRIIVIMFIALLLILGSAVALQYNSTAYAKNKATTPSPAATAKANMAKYSWKTKGTSDNTIRRSRLAQMNVVAEAAQVLNVLPIDIMEEMKKGKTLVQIAKSKGLTKAQFLKKLTDVENKIVDSASKEGTITKEHADALKEGQKDRLTKSLDMKAVDVNDHMAMDMGN